MTALGYPVVPEVKYISIGSSAFVFCLDVYKRQSYSKGYRSAMNRLTKEERKIRVSLFEELDRLETTVDIPSPHIYLSLIHIFQW